MYNLIQIFAQQYLNREAIGIREHSAENVMNGVLTTVYMATGIVAVIVIIIAGYIYVTSNGSPEKARKARTAILYAVIGIVVVLMAFTITQFVIGNI